MWGDRHPALIGAPIIHGINPWQTTALWKRKHQRRHPQKGAQLIALDQKMLDPAASASPVITRTLNYYQNINLHIRTQISHYTSL